MAEPLIHVTRRGAEYIATAEGWAHEGVSQTSARCAATHLLDRAHGQQWFLKHRIEQESASFSIHPAPRRTFGGRRG